MNITNNKFILLNILFCSFLIAGCQDETISQKEYVQRFLPEFKIRDIEKIDYYYRKRPRGYTTIAYIILKDKSLLSNLDSYPLEHEFTFEQRYYKNELEFIHLLFIRSLEGNDKKLPSWIKIIPQSPLLLRIDNGNKKFRKFLIDKKNGNFYLIAGGE